MTSGLVSVPTTPPRASVPARSAESARLRGAMGAVVPDPHRQRIARLRRAVGFAARGHLAQRHGFRPDTVFMLTLTLRAGLAWHPEMLTRFVDKLRKWCALSGLPCRYVWVAELQKRGAVHYHLALWLPASAYVPDPDRMGWWPHGSTRTERARAAVPYLMKYLSKGGAPGAYSLPNGARMYGVGGLEHSLRRARRWLGLPAWIQARSDIWDDWRRAPGGGWSDPDGFVIPGEFERSWCGDRYALVRVRDYGRPFNPDGPFSWWKA